MEPASGRALDTAPIAHTGPRVAEPTREEKRTPVAVATEAAITIEERGVDAERPARSNRKSPPLSVEEWVEPASSAPPRVDLPKASRNLPRPSWMLVLVALAVVGVIVWWVTAQRAPTVDARRVIDAELSAARAAAKEGHYAEPYEGSAYHHYSTVLTIDASNEQARAGLQTLADELIAAARTHLTAGRYAEAVIALNGARRIDPTHRGLPAVEGDLRRELQSLAERVPAKAAPAATEPAATATAANARAPSQKIETPKVEPQKIETPVASAAKASAPNAASGASGSAAKVAKTTTPVDVPKQTMESAGAASAPKKSTVSEVPLLAVAGATTAAASAATELPTAGANAMPIASSATPAASGSAVPEDMPQAQASTSDVTVESKKVSVLPPIVKYVPPEYPDEARVRGLEGWADLSFLVAPNGEVIDPRVEDSSRRQLFGRPALNAVRKWRYEPPESGHPALTERTRVRIEFQLSR
jgi:protein TonB